MLSFLLIDENQARFMMKIETFTLNIRHFSQINILKNPSFKDKII